MACIHFEGKTFQIWRQYLIIPRAYFADIAIPVRKMQFILIKLKIKVKLPFSHHGIFLFIPLQKMMLCLALAENAESWSALLALVVFLALVEISLQPH